MSVGKCNHNRLKKHWNKISRQMPVFSDAPSTIYYRRSEIDLIRKYFGRIKGKKLLKLDLWNEVHNTKILIWAADQGVKVFGLDISDDLVARAKKNFQKEKLKAKLLVGDMRKIKFPNNFFDFVFSIGTIEHITNPQVVVDEVYRVLKPGGKCLIGVPNKFHLFLRPILVKILDIFNLYPYSPEKAFSRSQLRKMLRKPGFEIIGESGLLFMPGSLRIFDLILYCYLPIFSLISRLLLMPFEWLERKSDKLKKYGYLIVFAGRKPKRKKA